MVLLTQRIASRGWGGLKRLPRLPSSMGPVSRFHQRDSSRISKCRSSLGAGGIYAANRRAGTP